MRPKIKAPPKPQASTLGYCKACNQKRYGVDGKCLVCGGKLQ
jgi:hypothetical protein